MAAFIAAPRRNTNTSQRPSHRLCWVAEFYLSPCQRACAGADGFGRAGGGRVGPLHAGSDQGHAARQGRSSERGARLNTLCSPKSQCHAYTSLLVPMWSSHAVTSYRQKKRHSGPAHAQPGEMGRDYSKAVRRAEAARAARKFKHKKQGKEGPVYLHCVPRGGGSTTTTQC